MYTSKGGEKREGEREFQAYRAEPDKWGLNSQTGDKIKIQTLNRLRHTGAPREGLLISKKTLRNFQCRRDRTERRGTRVWSKGKASQESGR